MKTFINKLINNLKKDSLIKGFSVLISGTVITQIVSLILAPMLTRLYTPTEYGINSVFISILTISGVVATLRLQIPIAMSNDERERDILSKISLLSSFILSLLLLGIIVFLKDNINSIFGLQSSNWLWILPISTLSLGAYEVFFQNLLSAKKYRAMAKTTILKVITQGIFQIVLYFASIGYMGLIIGNLLSYVISIAFMLIVLKPTVVKAERQEYLLTIKRNIDFPKYAFPAELASIASFSIIPLAITYLYSSEITGYYSLANRLIGIPIGLFGNSLRQVFVREASIEYNNENTVIKSFLKTSKILSIIAIPSAFVLFFAAPSFFTIVFGENWYDSGIFVQLMILFFLARFIVGPLTSTVNVIGKQKIGLYIHIALLIGIIGVTLSFKIINNIDPNIFILIISLVYSIIYFSFYFLIYHNIKKGVKKI
ncbi:lipopolysaccharide biosynthesis protein [Marinilactibacillus psychrotolerans]|uniref:lipopolysaccharide biosynthesis protein n=1 Tax=Marinilactibacillus psychrotolerans TaxID=191770 RepID=UPI00388AB36A